MRMSGIPRGASSSSSTALVSSSPQKGKTYVIAPSKPKKYVIAPSKPVVPPLKAKPQETYKVAPSRLVPEYDRLDKPIERLSYTLVLPGGPEIGCNIYPYAELLEARDEGLAAQRPPPSPPARPPPQKLNLAQKQQRDWKAAAAAARAAEYTLVLSSISAQGVPNADSDSLSDPYADFELLAAGAGWEELQASRLRGGTQPLRNTTEPHWSERVQLWLPPGSRASLSTFKQQMDAQNPSLWSGACNFLSEVEVVCLRTMAMRRCTSVGLICLDTA